MARKLKIIDWKIVNPDSKDYRIIGMGEDQKLYEWNWTLGEWELYAKKS